MTEVIVNFSGSATTGPLTDNGKTFFEAGNAAAGDTGGAAAPITSSLPDLSTGDPTGISFFQTQGASDTGSNGVSPPYSGDASWANNAGVGGNSGATYWFTSSGAQRVVGVGNLDPTHTYRIEGFSASGSAAPRLTDWSVDGATQTIEAASNSSETAAFTGVAPDENNQILITTTRDGNTSYVNALRLVDEGVSTPTLRKGSQFDVETTLSGTVTNATLNGNAITVDSQAGTTVTLTDSDGSITTSGEYDLVLTDDSADPDETIVVQVNVVGVAPSSNPLQKDGAALAGLTDVQIRIANGGNLNGVQRYYTATGTTDASGNLGNIDLSDTAADVDDSVLLQILTAAGDSITAPETVGLI